MHSALTACQHGATPSNRVSAGKYLRDIHRVLHRLKACVLLSVLLAVCWRKMVPRAMGHAICSILLQSKLWNGTESYDR